eukprot:2722336-Amphidinium_carterae.1
MMKTMLSIVIPDCIRCVVHMLKPTCHSTPSNFQLFIHRRFSTIHDAHGDLTRWRELVRGNHRDTVEQEAYSLDGTDCKFQELSSNAKVEGNAKSRETSYLFKHAQIHGAA